MLLLLKSAVGVGAGVLAACLWLVRTALAVVLLPTSGTMAALAALRGRLADRTVRCASDLVDGRTYVFRHRSGAEVRRTFHLSDYVAIRCPEDSFTISGESSTGEPGVQCFQKRLPSGEPTDAGVWINLECLFGSGPLRDTRLMAV